MNKHFHFKYSLISSALLFLPFIANAQNQSKSTTENNNSSLTSLLNVAPRSLSEQRLSPSSFPEEAEIMCQYEQCVFGLTKGLVIGGDAFGMIYAPMRQYIDPNWNDGSFYLLDFFGGFQILRDLNQKIFLNGQLGYRRMSHSFQNETLVTQGLSVKINYSQGITPFFTQALKFEAFIPGNSTYTNTDDLLSNSSNHKKFLNMTSYLTRISQKYPSYYFSLPADFEVANWGTKETGILYPIRTYAHLEPFYIQNTFSYSYSNISMQNTEKNFGLRMGATGSIESAQGSQTGRYSFIASAGIDINTRNLSENKSSNTDMDYTQRPWASPYLNLGASWQF